MILVSSCISQFQSVRADDDDEFVVLQKPIGEVRRAFNEMRGRHADMFAVDNKRRQTICIPDEDKEDEDSEADTVTRDSESD